MNIEGFVFLTDPGEIHIQFSREDHSGNYVQAWGVYRNLNSNTNFSKDAQNVVHNIESCDWLQTHEMGYPFETVHTQVFEISISCEHELVLEQISRKGLLIFQVCLKLFNLFQVAIKDLLILLQGIKIIWKHMNEFFGGLLTFLFNLFEFFCPCAIRQKLRGHRVRENHQKWWQQNFGSWNQNEKAERDEFDDVDFDLSNLAVLEVVSLAILGTNRFRLDTKHKQYIILQFTEAVLDLSQLIQDM